MKIFENKYLIGFCLAGNSYGFFESLPKENPLITSFYFFCVIGGIVLIFLTKDN